MTDIIRPVGGAVITWFERSRESRASGADGYLGGPRLPADSGPSAAQFGRLGSPHRSVRSRTCLARIHLNRVTTADGVGRIVGVVTVEGTDERITRGPRAVGMPDRVEAYRDGQQQDHVRHDGPRLAARRFHRRGAPAQPAVPRWATSRIQQWSRTLRTLEPGVLVAILLAILGVPLWLVLGGVGAGLWSRRTFRKSPGVFAMKARVVDSAAAPPKWKRQASYARWVHDVLIVHQGLAMVRNRALPVASASPATISSGEVRGLGEDPVAVRLSLDGGEVVEVAAATADGDMLSGPFSERLTTA